MPEKEPIKDLHHIANTDQLRICKSNNEMSCKLVTGSMRRFRFFPQTDTLIRWTRLEMMQRTGTKVNKLQKSKIGEAN